MFQSPVWLWLLLPLAAACGWLAATRRARWLMARGAALALVLVGLAGPLWRPAKPHAALLVDASLSAGSEDAILDEASALHSALARGHEVASSLFAGSVHPWAPGEPFPRLLERGSTRYDRALAAAGAADCIVLATDMRPVPGGGLPAVGVPVFVVPFGPAHDVRIQGVQAPAAAAAGSRVSVLATVVSNGDALVRVRAALGAGEAQQERNMLAGVPETFRFVLPATGASVAYGKVTVETAGDSISANNYWPFAIWLTAPPRVLAASSQPEALGGMLAAIAPDTEVLGIEEMEKRLGELPAVLVLEDVNPEAAPRLWPLLPALVADGGAGVLFLGGERAFGAGDIEPSDATCRMIPANLLPPGGKGIHVIVILDCSGSMARAASGEVSKLEAVRRALLEGVSILGGRDSMAVAAFNQSAWTALPPGRYDAAAFLAALGRLEAGGGTDISAGLLEGARLLNAAAGPAVVLLVSDGDPDRGEHGKRDALSAASALERPGVLALVAGTGENQDEGFLRALAAEMAGEVHVRVSATDLSRLLKRAIAGAKAEFIAYGREAPRQFQGHPMVSAPATLPPVTARNRLSVKDGAWTLLVCGQADAPEPLAALMEFGAGRTALLAVSSYQSPWLVDENAQELLKNMLAWLAYRNTLEAAATLVGGRLTVCIEGPPTAAWPDTLEAGLWPVQETAAEPVAVRLRRIERNLYAGEVAALPAGLYRINAHLAAGELSAFVSHPFAQEYTATGPDWAALGRLEAEGRIRLLDAEALMGRLLQGAGGPSRLPYALAALCLLLDLYLRTRRRPLVTSSDGNGTETG